MDAAAEISLETEPGTDPEEPPVALGFWGYNIYGCRQGLGVGKVRFKDVSLRAFGSRV